MQERILVLEGPKGTMIQRAGLADRDYRGTRFQDHPVELRNNNEMLNLVRPDLVEAIHQEFADAGADIVATNTFNGNRVSQADFGTEHLVREMNIEAAAIARRVAARSTAQRNREVFVAGTLGPTPRMSSLSPDVSRPGYRNVTFDQLSAAYSEQMEALLDGGVDLLIVETTFDTLNLKAALYAAALLGERRRQVLPVIASVTFSDKSGRTLSGQTVDAFWISVRHFPLLAVGINCGLGAAELRGRVEELAAMASVPLAFYPNAGLPNALGAYDQSPEDMARLIGECAEQGWVNVAGGCCGSAPSHIRAIADVVKGVRPRVPPESDGRARFAGLEGLTLRPDANFTMIGERTNVSGSRRFARLIREGRFEDAVAVARDQVNGGANILDVNMDEALLDSPQAMSEFLSVCAAEPDVARVPVMVDSSDWAVITAGLKATQGRCIVNSISLKDGEAAFLKKAREARRLGAALVVMALDEQGQADTLERKVAICRRAYALLVGDEGFRPEELIFDPNVLAIGTGMSEHAAYGVGFIEAVREIKAACPGALCSGGISNLSFAFRGNDLVREAMHAVFLYHAIRAGLDMGIVNAGQLAAYEDVEPRLRELVEDLVLNRRPDATDRLLSYSTEAVSLASGKSQAEMPTAPPALDERIAASLIRGVGDTIESEMAEALEAYGSALAVIEGPLMSAMKTIGDRFSDGRMFLPQVVKSARTMKQAVAFLSPHLSARDGSAEAGAERPGAARIVLATVKGDVHDIGKNIVGIVLACGGHEIIDLGVMASADLILDTAVERKADIVGLSGLITPSLDEMAHVAREMQRRGLRIPLLIGGATTSRTHTALRLAVEYEAPVVHVQDASRAGGVVKRLMDRADRERFRVELAAEQDELRVQFQKRRAERRLLGIAEARRRAPALQWSSSAIATPEFTGVRPVTDVSVSTLRPLIDWTPFLHAWDVRGRFPEVLSQDGVGERARELHEDAQTALNEMESMPEVRPLGVYGFFPANSSGDDIVLADEAATFHMLRQQTDKGERTVNYCLADFLAPRGVGLTDYVGLFVVTAGQGIHDWARRLRRAGDDYKAIMVEALADRLAEAFAEYLHAEGRRACGFGREESLSVEDLMRERYRGIRPAPGYPACPDHSEKPLLFRLLNASKHTGVVLTETLAMAPPSSICGFYLNHPEARYFPVGTIGRDQLEDYARRRGIATAEAEEHLRPVLSTEAQ